MSPQDGIAECPLCGEEFHTPTDAKDRNEKALDMLEEHLELWCTKEKFDPRDVSILGGDPSL